MTLCVVREEIIALKRYGLKAGSSSRYGWELLLVRVSRLICQFEPFKLYRKYKQDTDDKDAIVEIDGVDKIKLEDPYFQVNVRCGKNGELGAGVSFKDITDKSKIKQKGEYYIFPDAKIGGVLLTPNYR